MCANEALGKPLSQDTLLDIATQMEGHPDNVAPALYGIALSTMDGNKVSTLRFMPPKPLKLIVVIPEFTLATKTAVRYCLLRYRLRMRYSMLDAPPY